MPPTLTATLVQASVACGGCIDMNLFSVVPFLAWWLVLFLGWSLLLGPFVFSWNRVGTATDLRHPAKLFLWFLGFGIAGIVVLQGSVIGPFIFFAPVWLGAVLGGMRGAVPVGWRRFCQITLILAVLTIPLSYVIRGDAPVSRHGRPLPGNPLPGRPVGLPTPPAPPTAPATSPAAVPGTTPPPTPAPAPTPPSAVPGTTPPPTPATPAPAAASPAPDR